MTALMRAIGLMVIFFLFAELCDPTTPFVRVSPHIAHAENGSDATTADSPLVDMGPVHAALVAPRSPEFTVVSFRPVLRMREMTLEPQYEPTQRLRPPIFLNFFC